MTNWDGNYVASELGIHTPDTKTFRNLLGLALRKNPKRAHLLVSKVLGKHIPQYPSTIRYAASLLGKYILEQENLTTPNITLEDLTESLDKNIPAPRFAQAVVEDHKFVVFGYAETATCLGACVAYSLQADYIHSTRYPDPGSVNFGSFEEEHSHATSHHITPTNPELFHNRTVVLVDDELTTGKTILNTITMFENKEHHPVYYVATLTDLRTKPYKDKFIEFQKEHNVEIRVVSLLNTEIEVPADAVQTAQPILDRLKTLTETKGYHRGAIGLKLTPITNKELKNGATYSDLDDLDEIATDIVAYTQRHNNIKRILVLGLEEDTYLPLVVAERLQHEGLTVHFSSATRSPVVSYDNPEYAIQTRIRYEVEDPENTTRYAYNIKPGLYDKIILITFNSEQTRQVHGLIQELCKNAPLVEILERNN